jgi:hypothetical protein
MAVLCTILSNLRYQKKIAMTGVSFKGRLGNQLFQFCFLRYLKSNNGLGFYFFPNPHHAYLTKYFDLGFYYNLTLGSKLYSGVMRVLPRLFGCKDVFFYNFSAPRAVKAKNRTIYNGYFQSDWYLQNTADPLPIKIRKQYTDLFDKEFGTIFNNGKTIAVHIRLTDYKNFFKRDLSLPITYFKRELEKISDLDSYTVFFVSDDIEFVKTAFPTRPNFIFSSNNEITDFQIIHNADIAIISNSTFAWWACYLSARNKQVIAPKYWLGFHSGVEFPKGIMTSKFTWADVL